MLRMDQKNVLKVACIAFVVLAGVPVLSQTLVEPLPGTVKLRPAQPGKTATAARPCPEYGAGFVRIDGSRSCIRLSGAVAAEYGIRSGRGGMSTGSATGAVVQSETRTDTGYGELRTVVRGRAQIYRGLETAPYR
jgi:Porin subfamily